MLYQTPYHPYAGYLITLLSLLSPFSPLSAQAIKKGNVSDLAKLCMASRSGNLRTVKKCLRKNPTLINQYFTDPTSTFKGTPLHYAVGPKSTTKTDILAYLIMNGCALTSKSHNNDTPLHCALRFEKAPDVIETFIDAGSPLSAQNKFGETPLHCALFSGIIDNIVPLLVNGAPLDIANNKGLPAKFQTPNPKYFPRHSTTVTFIAQLAHYARLFHDAEDQVAYITKPIDTRITPQAQLLGFETLVETCDLPTLIKLHKELIYKNPEFLETLLIESCLLKPLKKKKPTNIPRKNFIKTDQIVATHEEKKDEEINENLVRYEKTSCFETLLCKHWLKTPCKIIPYVEAGKLDNVIKQLKIHMPSTKMHMKLLVCLCDRIKKLTLLKELRNKQHSDTAFCFK